MKVAQIEPVGGHGGCNFYDFALCQSLVEVGIDVSLYTCDKTIEMGNENFKIHKLFRGIYGAEAAWIRGLRFIKGTIASLLNARSNGSTIAHYHFYHVGPLELFSVLFARLLGLKVVATAHDVEAFKAGLSVLWMSKRAYKLCHRVIVHNKVSASELIEKLHVNRNFVAIIRHGNHLAYHRDAISQSDGRAKLGIEPTDFVLLFFGQIKEVKGLDLLLKAIGIIRDRGISGFKLIVAGKVWKDKLEKYIEIIKSLGIEEVVKLEIKYIPDDDLPYFYAAADLVVLPYRKIYQSGVVLMAMSFGKAVLVSDLDGMLEVVTNNRTGFVFKDGDVNNLADEIVRVYKDRDLLNCVALAGRKHMIEEYAWNVIGYETKLLYQSCFE